MSLRLLVSAHGDAQGRVFPYDFDDDRAQILLGRRGGVDVLLPHAAVSLVHARIERRPGGYVLVDDGSANGTLLNGDRLETGVERPLRQGDRITIAEFILEATEVVGGPMTSSAESSISVARRMVAEVLGVLGPGDEQPTLGVVEGPLAGRALGLGQTGRAWTLGRGPACDLVLDDPSVSVEHVRVRRTERGDVAVSDLGSACGLYVNDQFVADERALRDGDVLAVGRLRLRFADPADVYLRRLQQAPAPSPVAVETTRPVAPSPDRRSEWLVVAAAGGVALAEAAGLVYLWLS